MLPPVGRQEHLIPFVFRILQHYRACFSFTFLRVRTALCSYSRQPSSKCQRTFLFTRRGRSNISRVCSRSLFASPHTHIRQSLQQSYTYAPHVGWIAVSHRHPSILMTSNRLQMWTQLFAVPGAFQLTHRQCHALSMPAATCPSSRTTSMSVWNWRRWRWLFTICTWCRQRPTACRNAIVEPTGGWRWTADGHLVRSTGCTRAGEFSADRVVHINLHIYTIKQVILSVWRLSLNNVMKQLLRAWRLKRWSNWKVRSTCSWPFHGIDYRFEAVFHNTFLENCRECNVPGGIPWRPPLGALIGKGNLIFLDQPFKS